MYELLGDASAPPVGVGSHRLSSYEEQVDMSLVEG